MSKNRNFGLDLLRCIAILLVIIQHARHLVPSKFHDEIMKLKGGFYGVEIFFVLSGFLIGSIFIKNVYKEGGISLSLIKNFWIRRWFRTLPNYYLAIIIHLITMLFFFGNIGGFDFSYLFFMQNFGWVYPKFFAASWSLAVEEWFYLFLPILCFVGARIMKIKSLLHLLVGAILFFTMLRFLFAFQYPELSFAPGLRNIVVLRLDSIMFGVVLAYFYYRRHSYFERKQVLFFLLGVVFIVVSYFMIEHESESIINKVLCFSFSNLGIALCFSYFYFLKCNSPFFSLVIEKVSISSYSMYLYHQIPILLLFQKYWSATSIFEISLRYLVYWLLVFCVSYLVYVLYESPITSFRNRLSDKESKSLIEN